MISDREGSTMLTDATEHWKRVRRQLNNVVQYQTHTGDQHEMEMNRYKIMRENNTLISEDRGGFLIQDSSQKTAVCSKNDKTLISSSSRSLNPVWVHSGLDESTFCVWNLGMVISGAEETCSAVGTGPDPRVKSLGKGLVWKWSRQSWTRGMITCSFLKQNRWRVYMSISYLLNHSHREGGKRLFVVQKPHVFGQRATE